MSRPPVTLDKLDFLIHDFVHSGRSLEEVILKCRNGREVNSLIRRLMATKHITEADYQNVVASLKEKGLWDKYI